MTNNERLEIMAAIILAGMLPERVISHQEAEDSFEFGPKTAWYLAKKIHELSSMEPNL